MEPLHIPSSRSTWVPWAASSTFDSSHLPGLYPGKEICAPSVLRFHMPLAGFCHSPYPCAELQEPRHRTSLFVRSPQCLLTPCSLIWSTSLFWSMEALLSQPVCSLSSLHECVLFHSPKGPEFWNFKSKTILYRLLLDTSNIPYQSQIWSDKNDYNFVDEDVHYHTTLKMTSQYMKTHIPSHNTGTKTAQRKKMANRVGSVSTDFTMKAQPVLSLWRWVRVHLHSQTREGHSMQKEHVHSDAVTWVRI